MNRLSRPIASYSRVLLVAAAALWIQLASAQVLEQVPSDALVVAHAKNLQAISDKAAALAKQWGIVEMNPAMADPLGYLLTQANFKEGVDKAGDMAIVLANGNLQAEPPPMMVLIPVTDYQKFIGNFSGAQKDGELDKFKMSFGGEPGDEDTYAANWGHYAVLTPQKELLSKKPDGFKPSSGAAKEIASKDVVVLANMKVLGPLAKKHIESHKDEVNGQIDTGLAQNPDMQPYAPILKTLFGQSVNAAERFLSETDTAALSVDLQQQGVGLGLLADFIADSYLAKNIASIKGTDGSLLKGLPAGKYLMYGGGRIDSSDFKKAFDDFLAPLQDQLAHGNETMQQIASYLDAIKALMHDQQGVTFGMLTPSGALGSPLLQTINVQAGDAAALLKDQQKMLATQQDLLNLLPNQPKSKVDVKPDAKTVDGVSFTQVTTTMTDASAPGAAIAKQMLNMFYGPNGPVAYTGVVDEKHMLVYTGLDDATVSAAIKAVKDQNDPFTDDQSLSEVRKHLPQSKVTEVYINVGDIVATVVTYAKMLGMPIPINMKAGIPPVGMTLSAGGSSIRGDLYVPSDLIEQLVATALQFNMGGAKGGGL
jgi:hypothetical protein